MGRWKESGGVAVWDPNDSGPDQIAPPSQTPSPAASGPAPVQGDGGAPIYGSEGVGGFDGKAQERRNMPPLIEQMSDKAGVSTPFVAPEGGWPSKFSITPEGNGMFGAFGGKYDLQSLLAGLKGGYSTQPVPTPVSAEASRPLQVAPGAPPTSMAGPVMGGAIGAASGGKTIGDLISGAARKFF